MDFINQINWDYLISILLVFALIATKIWLLPYLKTRGINKKYMSLLEQSLLLGSMAFRADKTKEIFTIAIEIVQTLEKLSDLDSTQKHNMAIGDLAHELLGDLNISLDKSTLDRIIRIAVAYMGEK